MVTFTCLPYSPCCRFIFFLFSKCPVFCVMIYDVNSFFLHYQLVIQYLWHLLSLRIPNAILPPCSLLSKYVHDHISDYPRQKTVPCMYSSSTEKPDFDKKYADNLRKENKIKKYTHCFLLIQCICWYVTTSFDDQSTKNFLRVFSRNALCYIARYFPKQKKLLPLDLSGWLQHIIICSELPRFFSYHFIYLSEACVLLYQVTFECQRQ